MPERLQSNGFNRAGAQFTTTHWSVVLAARDGESPRAADALGQLCGTYWYPLYAYIRRRGHEPHDAQDLTQEFFARLLENNTLKAVQQERGKFRWFLLSTVKRFLANEWNRDQAAKRGGGQTVVSLDEETAEGRYRYEIPDHAAPNFLEYLTGTDSLSARDRWTISWRHTERGVAIHFPRIARRGFEVEWTTHLADSTSWQSLDVPDNRPFFPAVTREAVVEDTDNLTPVKFYRVRVYEP